VVSRGRG